LEIRQITLALFGEGLSKGFGVFIPMVQDVPGFLIVPKKTNSPKKLLFSVWITTGSTSNPFFVTGGPAGNAIEGFSRWNQGMSVRIGEISYLRNDLELNQRLFGHDPKTLQRVIANEKETRAKHHFGEKPIYTYEFFPFGKAQGVFGGKGIAARIERITLQELLRAAPKAVLYPSLFMTELREKQLKSRGMKIEHGTQPLYAQNILQAINRQIRRQKVKHRPKEPAERLVYARFAGKKLRKW